MRKLLFSMIIMACAASFSFAQSDDYNKVDIYAGFSHARVDFGGDFEGFNGVEGAVTGNISRYIGLKGDYAFHYKNFDAPAPFEVNAKTHTLVGGVQFKDNSKDKKVKPFAHLMAGFTNARVSGFVSESETGFAGVIGGGVDIKISPRVDFRAIQLDYNPTRLGGETQHNFRVGIGLVFR
ncbi:MAG TPA: outer membrane beta-barrel protein [Pyrinomonadaceae bacterium]|nr:outer membrane beta-barrel protein [Pyrinomonadaceae bacterium]